MKPGPEDTKMPWEPKVCEHDWDRVGVVAIETSSFSNQNVASSIYCKKCGYIIIRKQ